jgi:uncharacterized membrane protein (DUF373 family)
MAGYQEQEDNMLPPPEAFSTQQNKRNHQSGNRSALYSGRFLDRADSVVYAIVGGCFLFAAILALIYTFWAFGISIIELPTFPLDQQPGQGARAIIEFVSGLLLVLIIIEMLGTVIHYLQAHTTSLRPFLFIGIVSATRSILSIGARLSIEGLKATDFTNAMIELSVSAAVVLALGITLKLLGRLVEADK